MKKIESGPNPGFSGCFLQNGTVIVVAIDDFSRAWLKESIPRMQPWEGAKLSVLEMSTLRKPHRTSFGVPGSREKPEVVLARLGRINRGEGIGGWRVSGTNNKEWLGMRTLLLVTIPSTSIEALRERYF